MCPRGDRAALNGVERDDLQRVRNAVVPDSVVV
jgi:hypothetical protein